MNQSIYCTHSVLLVLQYQHYNNSSNCTITTTMKTTIANTATRPTKIPHRGAFIVLEGVDRCGKTTQVGLLVKHMMQLGVAAVAMGFPDRTTLVGNLINQYLQSKSDLDDRAIHLLFSANRWEVAPALKSNLLESKQTVVCDRYVYSGVAFSSAKETLEEDLDWCKSCDVGLPAPDAVIFLDLTQEQAEQRGGYVWKCTRMKST